MKRGFTLIELLAVITILSIIAIISVPMVTGTIESSNQKITLESVRELVKAASTDVVDQGYAVPYQYKIEEGKLHYQGGDFTKGLIVITNGNHNFVENLSTSKYCINGPLNNLEITKGACTNTSYESYISTKEIEQQMKESGLTTFDDLRQDFYLKGNVTNNYVSYSGITWRIVSFQKGMMKLISQGVVDSAGSKNYQDALTYLNGTFYNDLVNKDYVSESSYAIGLVSNATSNTTENVIASEETNHKKYKIGLLSAGEYLRAREGSTSFLANGTTWLLTKQNTSAAYYLSGSTLASASLTTSKSLRPVILLKDYVVFSGTGTSSDPYVVK